jgi:hypothetical protein
MDAVERETRADRANGDDHANPRSRLISKLVAAMEASARWGVARSTMAMLRRD